MRIDWTVYARAQMVVMIDELAEYHGSKAQKRILDQVLKRVGALADLPWAAPEWKPAGDPSFRRLVVDVYSRVFCLGRTCGKEVAITNRELDNNTMTRDWLDAGGLAQEVVEILYYLSAKEYCEKVSGNCKLEGYATWCTLARSRIYEDLWDIGLPHVYFEWIHEVICCCTDETLDHDCGPVITIPDDC